MTLAKDYDTQGDHGQQLCDISSESDILKVAKLLLFAGTLFLCQFLKIYENKVYANISCVRNLVQEMEIHKNKAL